MRTKSFRRRLLLVAFTLAWVASTIDTISSGAGVAQAADGIKAGQTITVQYVVGARTVKTQAVLGADGLLQFACPTDEWPFSAYVTYRLVRQDSGPEPKPEPKPDPKPDPQPGPDTKANFVYVIHESRPPTPDLKFAAIDNDKGWRDTADSLKVGYRVLDQHNQALKKMPAPLITANKTGLPAAVFVFPSGASKGEPLKSKTPADLDALIKKYGGGQKP